VALEKVSNWIDQQSIVWRLSGDLAMRPGETLWLTVTLPNEQCIKIRSCHVSLPHHRQRKESYLPSARLSQLQPDCATEQSRV